MNIDRYHRQMLLPQIGAAGQARLRKAAALLVGCGALGSMIAEQLVRAGIGRLLLADRDIVELTNLQRQVLFEEEDVREQAPKAVAAERRLRRVNSEVKIDARVTDVHAGNVEELAGCGDRGPAVDLILDGTDNVDTRNLLNDVSIKHTIPWIYGACVGTEGRCMAIMPPEGPCLRCVFPEPPAAAELPTCDTAGVLGSAAAVVASLQVTTALRVLLGHAVPDQESLITVDLWRGRFHAIPLNGAKRPDCPTCGQREFPYLDGAQSGRSTSLCGRNAVQVRSADGRSVDLSRMAAKLSQIGRVQQTPYLLRCALHELREIQLTVFPDGRAIIQGTADFERARSIYARFVGS